MSSQLLLTLALTALPCSPQAERSDHPAASIATARTGLPAPTPLSITPFVLEDRDREEGQLPASAASPPASEASFVGHTPDRVHTNRLDDEDRLWARGRSYKASFGHDGFRYIPFFGSNAPRNYPVRFVLEGVRAGGEEVPFHEEVRAELAGSRVSLERGPLTERYDLAPESVEQSFELPHALGQGDVEVRIAIETELAVEPDGGAFVFHGEHGHVRYGAATVLDAGGRTLALETEWDGAVLALRVPAAFLAESKWPVVIDPVVSTFSIDTYGANLYAPATAYDAGTDSFLTVYQEQFSGSDSDMYARRITIDGTALGDGYIDNSTESWERPDVANCAASGNFMVVAAAGAYPRRRVRSRVYVAASDTIGGGSILAGSGTSDYTAPTIGGDVLDGFAVVWEWAQFPELSNPYDLVGVMLDPNGFTGQSLIIAGNGAQNRRPNISKVSGGIPVATSTWLVAWMVDDGVNPSEIWGKTIRWDGQTSSTFTIASATQPLSSPSVSSPTNSFGPRSYVVSFTRDYGTDTDVSAVLWRNGTVSEVDISPLLPSTIFDDEYDASVDCDGHHFVLTATDRAIGSSQFRAYALTLAEVDGLLCPTETAEQLTPGTRITEARPVPRRNDPYDPNWFIVMTDYAVTNNANIYGARWNPRWSCLGSHTCDVSGYPNNTTFASILVMDGSDIAGGDVQLHATQLPLGVSGYFLSAPNVGPGFTPPGSHGRLCLQNPIARFLSTLQTSGSHGTMSATIDTGSMPLSPPTTVLAGETWTFQLWHREPIAGNSNFTNGIRVAFQ
ncbi:MAG: hypothetical protein GY711_19705 [bacterium]|nr:hypothetical protein [bacterium]